MDRKIFYLVGYMFLIMFAYLISIYTLLKTNSNLEQEKTGNKKFIQTQIESCKSTEMLEHLIEFSDSVVKNNSK